MADEPLRMNFDQFQTHLSQVFEQVRNGNQPVLVERNGETYRLEKEAPEDIWKNHDPEKVRPAWVEPRLTRLRSTRWVVMV